MTRRPAEMKFMGGCYVFPGGSVREEDCSEEILKRCRGLSRTEAQRILGGQLGPELSLGHWVAGIRELFEEVGVLLCITDDGAEIDVELQRKLDGKRQAMVRGAVDFGTFLESEGLYCDVERPSYFSHRVTPEKYPIRFDTRFFLARLPSGQTPLSSSEEVTESLWITPAVSLNQAENQGLPLMPPTLAALRTLAAFDSWDGLSAQYRLR